MDLFFVASSLLIAIPDGRESIELERDDAWGPHPAFGGHAVLCGGADSSFCLRGLQESVMRARRWTGRPRTVITLSRISISSLSASSSSRCCAALHYWFPKMSGRMLSERLGKWTFVADDPGL